MKYASYLVGQQASWGLWVGGGVVDHAELGADLPATLQGWIEQCAARPALAAQLGVAAAGKPVTALADITLQPCLPRPGKIVCLGINYLDHAKEGGNTVADYPTLFLRCATSLLAHGAALRLPAVSDKLDFEAELAVVIGQRTHRVAQADALGAVFGYACFNDATLRDYQCRTSQWTIGKNFDNTGSFGPCLVSADALPPGCTNLHIESRLNGQVMQSANTSDMMFGVAQTIALLSDCMTLEPGDVLVMGTPAGVGYARTPPVWLKAGDLIEVEIDQLGLLSNPVRA